MRAVDTNAVVRIFVVDDESQAIRARAVFAAGNVFVSTSVVLETEWVLRSVYKYPVAQVVAALQSLSGLPGVTIEHPDALADALRYALAGMEFTDALHLASARSHKSFVTFDQSFAKLAAKLEGAVTVELL